MIAVKNWEGIFGQNSEQNLYIYVSEIGAEGGFCEFSLWLKKKRKEKKESGSKIATFSNSVICSLKEKTFL